MFFGAGWVYFGKEPSKIEVINDIDKELINLFRTIKYHAPEVERLLAVCLLYTSNTYASINVLSNQVRRCLQYTTAAESQIIWKHKLDGSFNICLLYTSQWSTLCNARAKILYTRGSEYTEAYGTNSEVEATFYIRFNYKNITSKDRLIYLYLIHISQMKNRKEG